jgi:hypothetical protein
MRRLRFSLAGLFVVVTTAAVWLALLRALSVSAWAATGVTALLLLGASAAAAFVWALERSIGEADDDREE